MTTTETLTATLLAVATKLPLAWFVLGGSFIEEVVSPIPTYAVMITAGSVARVQDIMILSLVIFALLGAFGKTLACILYYLLADLFEDVFVPRFGKYIGVRHEDIEAMGARLNKRKGDHWLLIGLRTLPVIPSVPISIVAGLIHVNRWLFIWTTFVGTAIKNLAYLLIGFFGLKAFEQVLARAGILTDIFRIGLILGAGLLIGWFIWKRRPNR